MSIRIFRRTLRATTSTLSASLLLLSALSVNAAPRHDSASVVTANGAAMLAGELSGKSSGLNGELQRFYASRDFSPVWVTTTSAGSTWSPRAEKALAVLRDVGKKSLDPSSYLTPALLAPLPSDASSQIAAELSLTRGVMAYIRDLKFGKYNPRDDYGQTTGDNLGGGEADVLRERLMRVDLTAALDEVGPNNPHYDRLIGHLERYKKLVEVGGWPRLKAGGLLRPGTSDARVPVLRRILALTGDLPHDKAMALGFDSSPAALQATSFDVLQSGLGNNAYDADLEAAVKRFQARHGVEVDGLIGGQTRDIINVPTEDRYRQIVMNLERMRWQRNIYAARHVEVNIPEYRLRGYQNGVVTVDMPVIVGRDERQTPTMNDFIINVKFNPDWNVPKTIAEKDIVPKLMRNPFHANEIGLQTLLGSRLANPLTIDWPNVNLNVVRFRQPPGPKNPLGLMRFSLTNNQAIYLHDTPKRYLFSRDRRDASSGCVRVGDPKGLAEFLITDPQYDGIWIDSITRTIQTKYVKLDKPVPVSLNYYTTFVGLDGALNFRADIYGRDLELSARMS